MKILALILSMTSFFLWSCNSQKTATKPVQTELAKKNTSCIKTTQLEGVIKSQGITTFQYGSHTIVNNKKLYALRSDSIKLDDYIGKKVELTGIKINGYPIDGGPEFYNVVHIKCLK